MRKQRKQEKEKKARSKLEKKKESRRNKEKIGEASKCLSRTKKIGEGNLRSFFSQYRKTKIHENDRKIVPKLNVKEPPVCMKHTILGFSVCTVGLIKGKSLL